MLSKKRVIKYQKENFTGVLHTTLNPEGPGVVRIHLVPPKENGMSVAIINGQDIIPVNTSWSILLAEFIKNVNEYSGREIQENEYKLILNKTCRAVKKVYPFISKKRLTSDVYTILNTFKQIAYREQPDVEIGYMNIGEYAPNMQAPHRMDLMVSAMTKDNKWHCNQNCVHCYAAGQKQSSEEELSTEQWKKIIDNCRNAWIPQITFTGGEPTMREDLIELIDYSQWFVTRLNTNGIKLTKEYCEQLAKASLDSLQITFYSADEEIHNKLVGAQRYKETVAGIENALATGLSLSINTPLCSLNKDYVKTLEYLHSKGVLYVTCSGLITTGNAESAESQNLQLSTEEIKQILKDAVDYCFSNGMEISFTSPGWIEPEYFDQLGITVPTCGACLSNMAVTPGGNVVPCQSWLSGAVLGSMLNEPWEKIWNSEVCVNRRNFSSQMTGKCPLRTGVKNEK